MRKYKDWDEEIHWLLFAIRETSQDSLKYSPFELLFGRKITGPLNALKDKWLHPSPVQNVTVGEYIDRLHNTIKSVGKCA